MLLYWKIRYLDSRDKQFKDRELWLDTDTQDPVTKAAVEATFALNDSGRRPMLRRVARPEVLRRACRSSNDFTQVQA